MARVAVETEKTADQPRFLARRSHNRLVVALDESPARLGLTLGALADDLMAPLSDTDALPGLATAAAQLRDVTNTKLPGVLDAWPLTDERLVKLAAAASANVALSARRELYPLGMPAQRVARLAAGSLLGSKRLTPTQLRDRLRSRYPQAAPLPDTDHDLGALLRRAGVPWRLVFETDPDTGDRVPYFVNDTPGILSVEGATASGTRQSTLTTSGTTPPVHHGPGPAQAASPAAPPQDPPPNPDLADAQAFEAKLQNLARRGGMLYLTVPRRNYLSTLDELQRFSPAALDLEALLIGTLKLDTPEHQRDQPGIGGITPNQILAADAAGPNGPHWHALCKLIHTHVVPAIHQAVRSASPPPPDDPSPNAPAPRPALLTHPHWLARYGQTQLIGQLRQAVVDREIFGLWLLLPQDPPAPMLAPGHSLPVVVDAEKDRPPASWIRNQHRSTAP